MEGQLLSVFSSIILATKGLFSSVCGKISMLALFVGSVFVDIAPLIHIMMLMVLVDMILGIAVTVYKKGWGHITSFKLRSSLVKLLFYLIILIFTFLVESQLVNGYIITSKFVFAIITSVEMLSIVANMLLLFPNMPFLKLFKKMILGEMAKKLNMTEEEFSNSIK